jgi:hypothetical protein
MGVIIKIDYFKIPGCLVNLGPVIHPLLSGHSESWLIVASAPDK